MDRSQILAEVSKVVSLANSKFPNAKLPTPKTSFFDRTAVAGKSQPSTMKLWFNEVIAKSAGNKFSNTVIHEVAHLVVPRVYPNAKQFHGPEFKAVCKALGGTGDRCHSYDVSAVTKGRRTKIRYEVRCGCDVYMVTKNVYNAMNNPNRKVYCRVCGASLISTGVVKTYI